MKYKKIGLLCFRIIIGIIWGVIRSFLNALSLATLESYLHEGELVIDDYQGFVLMLVSIAINTIIFVKCGNSNWKVPAVIVELLVFCSTVYMLVMYPFLITCPIDTTEKIVYSTVYYICIFFDLAVPPFGCVYMILHRKKEEGMKDSVSSGTV